MQLAEKECGKDEILGDTFAIKRLERRNPNAMDVDIVTRNSTNNTSGQGRAHNIAPCQGTGGAKERAHIGGDHDWSPVV